MEKVVYKVENFVDFTGKTREFIFAAVSLEITNDDFGSLVVDFTEDSEKEVKKVLRIGVSVQNSKDEVNTELGKHIAYGKAMKDKSCFSKLYSTDKGLINRTVVEAVLEQESKFFKDNPGKYLKGYNKDKEAYLKKSV